MTVARELPKLRGVGITVLFDEAHSEAWTTRPELAARMQPAHPGDASYALAAGALRARGARVVPLVSGELSAAVLADCDVLVLAHPSDPEWERTTGIGSPRLSEPELAAVETFVRDGGGLVVLGETEQRKYGNNVNELLARFGLELANETVQDYEHHLGQAPSWVRAALGDGGRGRDGDLLARVTGACFYRATTVASTDGAMVLARTFETASLPGAPLAVAGRHGLGRVVVLGDSDLFGDDCLEQLSHRALWENVVFWAAGPARGAGGLATSPVAEDPAWLTLRRACDELAALQAEDGSLADVARDRAAAAELVQELTGAVTSLAPRFGSDPAYLEAVVADLHGWVAGGFQRPDFGRSLAAFRPERRRRDGAEHLVLFPMYKQNGSRAVCFEALIVRVPWPDWVAELERTRYGNPKFVPVELVSYTRGYESECAVLFPEMVSVAERAAENNFGAIFCDREAARLRRVAGAAAELLALNLPPDAARLLSDPSASRDAYILWDLIHDRAHSHGELPFDPFMVRQRAPYWMYALEELRCDLTAFGEAVALELEGLPEARHVQYAILLDRMLRFPITGGRVRNYDGLGGQLLFAYLHRRGLVTWEDNRLTIDWLGVEDGVTALRAEVEELYRAGIDRTKLAHWCAAHDLVAASVPPAAGSRWAAAVRDFDEVPDPRVYLDRVLDDEFPLSIFLSTLREKLSSAPA